jgi:hypothetical protein
MERADIGRRLKHRAELTHCPPLLEAAHTPGSACLACPVLAASQLGGNALHHREWSPRVVTRQLLPKSKETTGSCLDLLFHHTTAVAKPLLAAQGRGVQRHPPPLLSGQGGSSADMSWMGQRDARKPGACEGAKQLRSLQAAMAGVTRPHQGRRKGCTAVCRDGGTMQMCPSKCRRITISRGGVRGALSLAAFCT